MDTSTRIVPAPDKLAGALSYLLFFIPLMMDRRTEYTVFHMKQGFLINIFFFAGPFIPVLGGLIVLGAFVHAVFLAWKAYSGEKFTISYIYPYSENLISALGIGSWFTPKK